MWPNSQETFCAMHLFFVSEDGIQWLVFTWQDCLLMISFERTNPYLLLMSLIHHIFKEVIIKKDTSKETSTGFLYFYWTYFMSCFLSLIELNSCSKKIEKLHFFKKTLIDISSVCSNSPILNGRLPPSPVPS